MAREAYTRYAADWVINADADEFWLPRDAGRTLRDVFLEIPRSLTTFQTPVIDMTGSPAKRGTGLQRLTYRDNRTTERLFELGLHAHSTPNAVHIGSDVVEVSQGNHAVNLVSEGNLAPELALEVLHFPWRSWEQFERKVHNAGLAYENNPDLTPSPNHHGMREYRRWKAGTLLSYYVLRHPSDDEIAAGLAAGDFVHDDRIARTTLSPIPDELLDAEVEETARRFGTIISPIERDYRDQLAGRDERIREILHYVDEGKQHIDALIERVAEGELRERGLQAELQSMHGELRALRNRKSVRLANRLFTLALDPRSASRRAVRYAARLTKRSAGRVAAKRPLWRLFYQLFARGFFRVEPVLSRPAPDAIPLIMCLWNRPERIGDILRELAQQDSPVPLRILFWNNNRSHGTHYRETIRHELRDNGNMSVEFVDSPVNMGGVARFFLAAKLRRDGYRGSFIMLDDDEVVPPDFVSLLLAAAGSRTIAGHWAFRQNGSYWNREEVADGEPADHVGTGGTICDIDIVQDRRFFSELPTEYAFLEDQWMSHYASVSGWTLKKVKVDISFVLEELNQYHALIPKKDEFYRYLKEQEQP
jgi:hypothetical protein